MFIHKMRFSFVVALALVTSAAFAVDDVMVEGSNAQISCGDTILVDTKLDYDLVDCPGNGLIIGADNIILDGNGHTIDGQEEGSGVIAHSRDGVVVKNLRVSEFSIGISLFNTDGSIIEKNDFLANNRGVRLYSSSDNTISYNDFSDSHLAIRVLSLSNDNIIVRNTVTNTAANAINLEENSGNIVSRNKLLHNGRGISLFFSNDNTISENDVSETIVNGFKLISSVGNNFIKNESKQNGGNGFEVDSASSSNLFRKNKSQENRGWGFIDFSSGGTGAAGTDNMYTKNKCKDNNLGGSSPLGLCEPKQ